MSKARLLASWTISVAAVLLAAPCQAQDNIDRGKTPAQTFADTCGVCHRSPRALKRTSTAFLRQHYAPSSAAASAMASYLAGIVSEPAQQPKRSPAAVAEARPEPAKQQPKRQQPTGRTADQPQAAPSQASGELPVDAVEGRSAPVIAERSPAPPPLPKPVLEPFEE